jgi:ABC-type antimicrobial peptide transport system permease subunit
VAVLALGLAIGLNATVFTFVNAVLIRGLPFHHPEQIAVPTRDPVTFAIIVSVLVVVTLAACLIPARRATRLDPLNALRAE